MLLGFDCTRTCCGRAWDCFFSIGQRLLRKLDLAKTEFWKSITIFLCKKPILSFGDIFTFSNSCAIQIKLGTNELLKKTALEAMGYWQKTQKLKKGRLLQSTTRFIRVKKLEQAVPIGNISPCLMNVVNRVRKKTRF